MASKSPISEERIKLLVFKRIADSLTTKEKQELADLTILYPEIKELISRMEDKKQVTEDLRQLQSIYTVSAYVKLR